ncbi:MAG TPA: carboxypeptidase regulatory-like domain-containing protein [Bryobacteraceae bacterium]|nr:carboxypeptidase regulatory-like domain-containing protein [Bryobacteraceae bacterium]
MKLAGAVFGLLFFAAVVGSAQTARSGAISGVVTDPNQALVGSVEVTATSEATGDARTTRSQSNGSYMIPLLPPGTYRVEFRKDGFKNAVTGGIAVAATETARLDIQLELGTVQVEVTVNAEAQLLETQSAAMGRVTSGRMVMDLPLAERNFTQIVGLNPGVAADVENATVLGRGNGGMSNFSTGGGSIKDNNYQMDGVGTNDIQNSGSFSGGIAIPNPDTIQEFRVQTQQYDASYGRNGGANVNVITKGGGNAFHGSLWEFFRNEHLNANDFFFNRAGQPRPLLRQNQYGGTIGGPIIKDRLFFFGSFQGTRQLNGVSTTCSTSFVMPPLTDDRSRAALGRIFAGQKGSNGVAISPDGSNISAQALALLSLKLPSGQYAIPSPQKIDPSQPFGAQGSSVYSNACTFNENQYMANVDYLLSAKSRLAYRLFLANSDEDITFQTANLGGPTAPGWPVLNPNRFVNTTLTHSYVFTPSLVNEFEVGYYRQWAFTNQTEPVKYSDFGVNAPSYDNGIPEILILGGLTLGGNGQSLRNVQNHYILQDTLSYTLGRHTLRFGGGIERTQDNQSQFHYIAGMVFLGFPDLLLGGAGNVYETVDLPGLFDRAFRVWDSDLYVQDDFKVSPRLTLNLGFRYERLGNISDALGRNGDFDYTLANQNPPATGTFQGFTVPSNFQGTVPTGVTRASTDTGIHVTGQNTWNPKFGFAWQLPHTDRMVLRGGYGTYHQHTTGQPFIQLLTSPPFALLNILVGPQSANLTFANPFPPAATLPQFAPYSPTTNLALTIIDQNFRPPTLQRYSMGLQTKLFRDLVLDVSYDGSRDTHLLRTRSINQANLASASNPIRGVTTNTVANIPLRVPYQGFTSSGLTDIEPSGAAWYNALDVSLSKRYSYGLQFLASYTWSKLLSTDSNASNGANGGSSTGNQNDPSQRYGPDAFIRDQRFVLSAVYAIPGPKNARSLLGEALSGWQLGTVTTIQSGQLLTLTETNSNNVFGITNDRAQIASGCTYSQLVNTGGVEQNLNTYFNKSCFPNAFPIIGADGKATTFGNSGVGIIRGPGQKNVDFSVVKRFPVTDASRFEFRAEFFNVLNHPNFSNPTLQENSASFGRILTTAVNPRVIQLALKFSF